MKILTNLKPYKSFLMMQVKDQCNDLGLFDNELPSMIAELISAKQADYCDKSSVVCESETKDGIAVGSIKYALQVPVSWALTNEPKNTVHHLVVTVRKDRKLVACASDSRVSDWLLEELFGDSDLSSYLTTIDPCLINAALISSNDKVKALWLGGIHKRISTRADSKFITGLNLRDALDPLGDQTYTFTAVKCKSDQCLFGANQLGITPGKSRMWIGPSKDQGDFVETAEKLLDRLAEKLDPVEQPFPILCTPESDCKKIAGAYDLSLIPPWVSGEIEPSSIPDDEKLAWIKWSEDAEYRITNQNGSDFTVTVSLQDREIGRIDMHLEPLKTPRVKLVAQDIKPSVSQYLDELTEARDYLLHKSALMVWYESGHTVHGHSALLVRYRAAQFDGIEWLDFGDYDITLEKPKDSDDKVDLHQVGSCKSLFCWLKTKGNDFFGDSDVWIACDDQANEKADFIWFADGQNPVLRLIHIKAATSKTDQREIKVGAFEIVVSQAVKNLIYLDNELLSAGLKGGADRIAYDLVWHNGAKTTRTAMLDALTNAGVHLRKEVVIIQPHIFEKSYLEARNNKDSQNGMRLRLLDSLLLNSRTSVNHFSASFRVLCSKNP